MPVAMSPSEYWSQKLGSIGPASEFNNVKTLIDGPDAFAEIHNVLLTATSKDHFIYLLGWYLDENYPLLSIANGPTFYGLVKARPNVEVRVMLWRESYARLFDLVYTEPPISAKQPKTRNASAVDNLRRLPNVRAILDGRLPAVWNSHHQKLIVVRGAEGLVGLCGGVDINSDRVVRKDTADSDPQNSYSLSSKPKPNGTPLHDVHCAVRGPGAKALLDVFEQRWLSHPESKPYPPLRSKMMPPPSDRKGDTTVQIVRTFNDVPGNAAPVGLQSTPTGPSVSRSYNGCIKEHSVAKALVAMIRAARRFIYIEDQYMIDPVAAQELSKARNHVQHIIILIPHTAISDLPEADFRRKSFIDSITKSYPVKSNFADGRLSTFNVYYKGDVQKMDFGELDYIHAKTWIVDDEIAFIGSANCNRRGWSSDSEVGAVVFDNQSQADGLTSAQRLRISLWAKHLNLQPDKVRNALANASKWLSPPLGSRVKLYTPLKDDRLHIYPPLPRKTLDKLIDDDFDQAPLCDR